MDKQFDILEWLNRLAKSNVSNETDDKAMQALLRRIFPRAVVTCGVVYTLGAGEHEDIHTWSSVLHTYIVNGVIKLKD
jgi:hypothetical protein